MTTNGVAHGLTATVELHLHIDDRELCEELSRYADGRELVNDSYSGRSCCLNGICYRNFPSF